MLVLFGMMVSGYVVGANRGALYIRAEYPEAVRIVAQAVEELEQIGMHGEGIGGTDFNFNFKVIEGADVSPVSSPLGSGVNTLKQQLEGLKKLIESIG